MCFNRFETQGVAILSPLCYESVQRPSGAERNIGLSGRPVETGWKLEHNLGAGHGTF